MYGTKKWDKKLAAVSQSSYISSSVSLTDRHLHWKLKKRVKSNSKWVFFCKNQRMSVKGKFFDIFELVDLEIRDRS